MKGFFQKSATVIVAALIPLVVLEVLLRVGVGAPEGLFAGLFPGDDGLYPENRTIEMYWGPIPYTVEVNSHGFRGPEFETQKPEKTVRIITIGDSITDGFFVDNDATFQHYLQETLRGDYGWNAEVINAARGGGSIDKEFVILKKHAIKFDPDIVVLTFVTNDISDLGDKAAAELASADPRDDFSKRSRVSQFLLTQTALGEVGLDLYLLLRSKHYRQKKARLEIPGDRYDIAGASDHERNVKLFHERFHDTDGWVLEEPYPERVEKAIDSYCRLLGETKALCSRASAGLLLVYFPAYPQVYDDDCSLKIQQILADRCSKLGIDFLDLTPAFKREGRDKVLHLAPVDFHPSPEGNRLIASEIAEYLDKHLRP